MKRRWNLLRGTARPWSRTTRHLRLEILEGRCLLAGTWTPLTNQESNGVFDRIDFVYFSAGDGVTVTNSTELDGRNSINPWPSDHRAVLSTFLLKPPPLTGKASSPVFFGSPGSHRGLSLIPSAAAQKINATADEARHTQDRHEAGVSFKKAEP